MTVDYQAAGTVVKKLYGAGTSTVSWPTHISGDIGLLFVQSGIQSPTPGYDDVPSLTTANGFEWVGFYGASQEYASNTWRGACVGVFWCRATSASMSAPVVSAVGYSASQRQSVILTYRGCVENGKPFLSVSEANPTLDGIGRPQLDYYMAHGKTGNGLSPSTQTIYGAPYIACPIANARWIFTRGVYGQITGNTYAIGNLTSITERLDSTMTGGYQGSGLLIGDGILANPGSLGSVTNNNSGSSFGGAFAFGLKPSRAGLNRGTIIT